MINVSIADIGIFVLNIAIQQIFLQESAQVQM
jgi:hypothetical protein